MIDPSVPLHQILSARRRALISLVLIVASVMVVLDSSIANVALPHMQATLGANSETVAWVLTSYILASAVAIPLTGWLADRFGRRLLFTVSIAGFTISSAVCGFADTLGVMVAARIVQGLCGAFAMPLGQAMLYDIYPPEQHAGATTIWGMGVMLAQIVGPSIGGFLTDRFDWRWVFFINLPIGLAVGIAGWFLVTGAPRPGRRFDARGYAMLAVTLAALQLLLDRGTQQDWFNSTEIVIEAGVALGAGWMFAWHAAFARDPILPRGLLGDANFAFSLVLVGLLGGVSLGGAALVAPMLQRLLAYPVLTTGLVVMPRGFGTFLGFLIANRLMRLGVDGRLIIFGGMIGVAVSLWMMTDFALGMDAHPVMVTGLVQGIAMGVTVMPMNLLAFTTLPAALRTDGASFYSLARTIGGSAAIAGTGAVLAGTAQVNHAEVGAALRLPPLQTLEAALLPLGMPIQGIVGMLEGEVSRQALMIAYVDVYWAMMWAAILCAPLALLMRRARRGTRAEPIVE